MEEEGEEEEEDDDDDDVTMPYHAFSLSSQAPLLDISTLRDEGGRVTYASLDKMRPKSSPAKAGPKSMKDFSLQAPLLNDFCIQAPPPPEITPYKSYSDGSGDFEAMQSGESDDGKLDDNDDFMSESAGGESAKTRRNRKKRLRKEAKKKLDPIDELDVECGLSERPWSDEIVGPGSVVSKTIYSPYSESEVVIELPSSSSPGRDRMDVLLSSPEVQQQHTLAACDGDDGVEFDSSSGSDSDEEEEKSSRHHQQLHHPVTPVPAAMDETTCSKFVPASPLGLTVVSPASTNAGASKNVGRVHSDSKQKSSKNNADIKDSGKGSVLPRLSLPDSIPSSSSSSSLASSPHSVSVLPSNAEVAFYPTIDPFAFEDDNIDPFAFEEDEGDSLCLYLYVLPLLTYIASLSDD